MPADSLKLKPSMPHRVQHGHPWVYDSEVEAKLPAKYDGELVSLIGPNGRFLGTGIYNGNSRILWRRIARKTEDAGPDLDRIIDERIRAAISRRRPESCRRLVWSEADSLPGLIVDQYEDVLVVQTLTLGMDRRIDIIAAALGKALSPSAVIFRNDAPSREFEGLERKVWTLDGREFEPRWFRIDGFDYHLDLLHGHKTGFYLDQREQHSGVARFAKGRTVLDAFCNQGAFALHAARAGTKSVIAIDVSTEAIAQARANATRAGLAIDFQEANVFDWFTEHRDERFGLIVLDPPSFARNKAAMQNALRGYKELNLRALRMLEPGGILATYSCSQHCTRPVFMDVLSEAACDSGRTVRVLEQTGQPADHPVLLNMPESEYLKGAILQAE